MTGETLIQAENLSKKFCRDLNYSLWYGLSDLAREFSGKPRGADLRKKEFWAINDVSFDLRRGEVLGLIGPNGAGKTTLLRMLNGLIKPDTGKIKVKGRVGALIALGMGFNPILSGRENVYVNGSILGLRRREIDGSFEEIVEFAELEEFIDSPIRSYSTGMRVRLGFATAIKLIKPDILLLDEILAVGDAAFRARCINEIVNIANRSAVVFVSHNETQIKRIASRILLLESGRQIELTDDVAHGFAVYNARHVFTKATTPWICKSGIAIGDTKIDPQPSEGVIWIHTRQGLTIDLSIASAETIRGLTVRIFAFNTAGEIIVAYEAREVALENRTENKMRISIDRLRLASGVYDLRLEAVDQKFTIVFKTTNLCQLNVNSDFRHSAPIELEARPTVCG